MSLSRSTTPTPSVPITTPLSSGPLNLTMNKAEAADAAKVEISESSEASSRSTLSTLANWECYECGFLNYDGSSICQACFKKCLYCDEDYYDAELLSEAEDEDCEDSDCNNISSKSRINKTFKCQSSRSCMLDIISFINNNSIKYEDSKRIMIHNVSESMANENLGNQSLFGVFGDVKKIEIIRNGNGNSIKNGAETEIKAEITFYESDSVVALMKLSSSYHNYKIFA